MGPEHLDEALVFGTVLLQALELIAAGAERAGRGITQRGDRPLALPAGIDQVLGQRADDAVAAGVDIADPVPVLPGRLDQAAGRGVDDRRHPAGLCIERILTLCHR